MTFVKRLYTFQNQLKNTTLLPAEKTCQTVGKGAFITRMDAVKLQHKHYSGKKKRGGRLRIWNFENNVEFSGHDQEKIMCNFQGSWFQVLKFLKGVTQLCGVSMGEALFCLEFPRGKVKKPKKFYGTAPIQC